MFKRAAILTLFLPSIALAQPLDSVVAVVNDGVITASELNAQVQLLRQQILAGKMQEPSAAALRKQVLQHLIDVDLELQLAKQNSITVDNVELDDTIEKIAANNKLTMQQLRDAVSAQGLSWEAYRENLRKEILISRVQQKAVGKDINVTPQQVEEYLKTALIQEKSQWSYHLQNIVIPLPEEPSPEELKKGREKAIELLNKIKKGADFSQIAIEESSGEFALEGGDLGDRHLAELPEVFSAEVMKMQKGQVAGPIRTGNGFQLIKLIDAGGADQNHETLKTHVRHILIKQDANMTAEEAVRQANNLYQQIHAGKDFALMARQYSLDTSSATKGGDLGWVSPGDLVPAFEKAMDKLPLNTVSKPIKTVYGWHLIEVTERKKINDSDTYRRQKVRQFLQQRKFNEAVQNWQQHLRSKAYIKIMEKELV